jgi:hypothetical protein
MPFFEWARMAQQQQQQPHHQHQQARGCRGSRRDVFSSIFRDVVAEGATAFEQAAKENDNEDLASLARAFGESFRTAQSAQAQAQGQAQQAQAQPRAAQQQKEEESGPSPVDQAAAAPRAMTDKEDEEWEVPDVTPNSSSDDPFVKWQAALQQLATLGFTESEKYVEFLEEERGDLERVVNRIVRRAA